jgi:NAD+ kinase
MLQYQYTFANFPETQNRMAIVKWNMLIKRVGILYHPMAQATCTKANELAQFVLSKGVDAWTCSAWDTEKALKILDSTDLIVTTGGDGTILRAAQVALQHQIPITGVNMGNLGFLTELKAEEALQRLPEILAGGGWLDERAMLEAEVQPAGRDRPDGIFYSLNDVTLARGSIAKLIQVSAIIDSRPLTTYRADGVILATATGSTGYSLAAGGPVLYPQSADILLVPIVSHLSLGYSLILPSSSLVELKLISSIEATLSIDGHNNIPLPGGSVIRVKQSRQKTRFLRLHEQNTFFNVLEEKLRGKN